MIIHNDLINKLSKWRKQFRDIKKMSLKIIIQINTGKSKKTVADYDQNT